MLQFSFPHKSSLEALPHQTTFQDEPWTLNEFMNGELSIWMIFLRDMLHYAIENDDSEIFRGLKKWRLANWDCNFLADIYPASLRCRLPSFLDKLASTPFRHPGSVADDPEVQAVIACAILNASIGPLRPFFIQLWKMLFPGRELEEVRQYWMCVENAKQANWRWVTDWLEDVRPGKGWREKAIIDAFEPENWDELKKPRRRLEKVEDGKSWRRPPQNWQPQPTEYQIPVGISTPYL